MWVVLYTNIHSGNELVPFYNEFRNDNAMLLIILVFNKISTGKRFLSESVTSVNDAKYVDKELTDFY